MFAPELIRKLLREAVLGQLERQAFGRLVDGDLFVGMARWTLELVFFLLPRRALDLQVNYLRQNATG